MATWTMDPMHSEIGFKVRHLVISNVSGKFTSFEGTVIADNEDFSDAKVTFSADIDSISTGPAQRDEHLKSADFFDAANHPKLTFESTAITPKGGDEFEMTGDLTIRGTKKSVTLNVELGGIGPNAYGQTVAGFELNGKINRKDFGLNWSAVTEAGGIVVADEVKLHINAELVKQA
ncbi:YceI family protein [Niabella drilacis]|uniref:Polyisoprenoid-binding protein YceI n=1 Tax=Niabella drilacis (strain DSM 25811 / CCM 8410 / CCUG 62505 / LMG 26954 / E90) TaxID=1285928 RepID=A0A1G6PQK1_NIADE|nr:YceI family protein [Niabella drilacis]SDC81645.1 Polyisoprenoid-binding protein YceI [Niabella drilacis]